MSGVLLLRTSSTFSLAAARRQGGAVLLSLGKELADRLAGGIVNFQFRRGVGGGGDHWLRLCGRAGDRLGDRGRGGLRRGGRCRRLSRRLRRWRCLSLRRGLHRFSATSGSRQIANFRLRRAYHVIVTGRVRRLSDLSRNRAAVTDGAPFYGGFEALLDGAAEDRRPAVQRQESAILLMEAGL